MALALLAIGIGVVHWAKSLMSDAELVEQRHGTRGTDQTRATAAQVFALGTKESGFTRRSLVRNSLIGAIALTPIPAVVLFRDLTLTAEPNAPLRHTLWAKNVRLTRDPSGTPIKASDVTYGSSFHVIPEGLNDEEDWLEQKAKAASPGGTVGQTTITSRRSNARAIGACSTQMANRSRRTINTALSLATR